MSHPLERRVARAIRRHGLAAPGDRVAIAISGGPDSVALAWLFSAVARDLEVGVAGLIHVHHGLRGPDADADESFCRALASRLDVSIDVSHVDVAAVARARKRSVEAAAREVRYSCFLAAADRLGASVIATGHTLDDQAETVLLRLLRGAGARGLTGIRVRRGPFVRPLLGCRHEDLMAYLTARHEPFREDLSNADRSIPRNRIRHELLPVIDRMAPGARRALARVAMQSADDEGFFRDAVIRLAPSVVLPAGDVCVEALAAQPPALARRLVRWALEAAVPDIALTAAHLDSVLKLAASQQVSGHLDLPGVVVERDARTLTFTRAAISASAAVASRTQFEYALPCPGAVEVPEAGVTLLASVGEWDSDVLDASGQVAVVRGNVFEPPFTVRSRRDGDRLQPLGAPGRRKLQDVFVDRKVPRSQRDRVPIVTDATGRIVWVAGVTVTEEGRVKTPSKGVVILTLKKGLQ